MKIFKLLGICLIILQSSYLFGQKIGVVDVQKVFDGYQKVKEAREKLEKSKKIATEELQIFRDELEKIVNELKEMEDKLKNPNIDSSALQEKFREKQKLAKVKYEDMAAYEKRTKATINQRELNTRREALEDVRAAIKKVAGVKGLDLVLNSTEQLLGVFYFGDQFDFTEEVIITLNTEFK